MGAAAAAMGTTTLCASCSSLVYGVILILNHLNCVQFGLAREIKLYMFSSYSVRYKLAPNTMEDTASLSACGYNYSPLAPSFLGCCLTPSLLPSFQLITAVRVGLMMKKRERNGAGRGLGGDAQMTYAKF